VLTCVCVRSLQTNGPPSPTFFAVVLLRPPQTTIPQTPPQTNTSPPHTHNSIPIYVSSFLCHFNVLPVYSELRHPTRERAHNIVHFTMGTTLALYLWVGLMGYAYA
jgi:amino acid permease